jgi:hypothetical protein
MTKRLVKLSIAATLGLITLSTGALAVDEVIELDTLILYSQGSADKYGGDAETRINHLLSTTNKIYEDSGLNVRLNAVKIQQYDMDDAATSGSVLSSIRKDAAVHEIRNQVGADTVVMYRPYANDGACGMAYQNNNLHDSEATWVEKYMYAHVTIDCGGYVTAHEVGHNSGLGHSEAQGSSGAYEYARGHGVQDNFTTVMAYRSAYNGSKVYKYSSPELECNGLPCGVEEGEEKAADAVKALRQTLPLIEKFRAHIDIPNNNNTDDNNGTTDDGAEQLAAALKAYNDQKNQVAEDKITLGELKTVISERKEAYLGTKTEYTKQKLALNEKRTAYKKLVADYRLVVAKYKVAKADYKAKRISKEALLAVKAEKIAARAVYKSYYVDVYKAAHTALKTYRTTVKAAAYNKYKEARTAYRAFYTDTYKVAKTKLRELRKIYRELKKVYG